MKRKPKVKQPPKVLFLLWNKNDGATEYDYGPVTPLDRSRGWRRIKYSLTSRVTPGGRE